MAAKPGCYGCSGRRGSRCSRMGARYVKLLLDIQVMVQDKVSDIIVPCALMARRGGHGHRNDEVEAERFQASLGVEAQRLWLGEEKT